MTSRNKREGKYLPAAWWQRLVAQRRLNQQYRLTGRVLPHVSVREGRSAGLWRP